jgi:hypothetical protein
LKSKEKDRLQNVEEVDRSDRMTLELQAGDISPQLNHDYKEHGKRDQRSDRSSDRAEIASGVYRRTDESGRGEVSHALGTIPIDGI